ncbi:MAG: altronate dehydratase [Eubacterium sp.]|nr:altronate dehydratase [Eubacterium sp.]
MKKLFVIDKNDNVAVALEALPKGYTENGISLVEDIPFAHKVALHNMKKGDSIIKYNNIIGTLTRDVKAGEHIHTHNLKTNLTSDFEYSFSGNNSYIPEKCNAFFYGYKRPDGSVGTRNEIWVISTVGCVNNTIDMLVQNAKSKCYNDIDGVFGYTHPFGCSQMGDDQENTRKIISALIRHPNAGGVLVVSLGCENSNAEVIKKYLGDYDKKRVKFLVTQNVDNELEVGEKLIDELHDYVKEFKREEVSAQKLVIGLKCGGSDALSGITANPLCGKVTDKITSFGASAVLTEVPEMFGAEHILMKRAESKVTYEKTVSLIKGFKNYFSSHNQECFDNPSPGNHDGGITTLEEKSLGCIQKGGNSIITDVINYGEQVKKSGLSLLNGPGNDIVATTNLAACGANIILFTTGRGTPLGAPVPTIKISSNTPLFERKNGWIDFDSGRLLSGDDIQNLSVELFDLILKTASGYKTKNETNDYRQISIFKDGVIM